MIQQILLITQYFTHWLKMEALAMYILQVILVTPFLADRKHSSLLAENPTLARKKSQCNSCSFREEGRKKRDLNVNEMDWAKDELHEMQLFASSVFRQSAP